VTGLLTFQLAVTDPIGQTDTCVTTISIQCVPTTITEQPANEEVCPGDAATFTVAADSISELTYQWQQRAAGGGDWNNLTNGGGISGVDTPTLALASIDANDAGDYRCVVTSPCGVVTSSEAALSVGEDTRIVTQPVDQSAYGKETVTFSVTASGSGLRYQWQFNGVNITDGGRYSGATSRTLTFIIGEGSLGGYRCVVRGDCGSATSRTATLSYEGGGTVP
jgi:trimeric autotransporter adhesin